LVGESFMMLADISGNFGKSRQAVERFDQAIARGDDLNIELYNYCSFRQAEMCKDLEDFPAIVDRFTAYIERNREGSNLPMAVYWVATAKWQAGDQKGAMDYLLQAVDTYGRDRKALGIDLLLQEWVGKARNLHSQTAQSAWRQFRDLAERAGTEKARTLELRLKHTLLFAPRPGDTAVAEAKADREVKALRAELLRSENVPDAPPTLLEFMIDEAPKENLPELATAAAETVVRDFTETDYVVPARMWLARRAIAAGEFHIAEEHLNVVREAFATTEAAADALLMLGDMYLSQRMFSRADRCYKDVLGVRAWRGPKWPQAVFGRGECARQQRQYLKACAHYERIYLLYSHYRPWVAKAYLARAQCLGKLNKTKEAREVLETMVADKELAEFPEYAEAESLLAKLGGR
jgi:TolA-binding protein